MGKKWRESIFQLLPLDGRYFLIVALNEVKTAIFVFPHFLEHYRFLKVKNIFFEDSSPKGFFWQIIRIFDFFSLASDSWYLQSWALKHFEENEKRHPECGFCWFCLSFLSTTREIKIKTSQSTNAAHKSLRQVRFSVGWEPGDEVHFQWTKWPLAWISSDYFESLLLPQ